MDALSVLRRLTPAPFLLLAFAALCLWPNIGGIWRMIDHHSWMMMDIDAVLCGAHNLARDHNPYALHPVCRSLSPAAYVYAPQFARLLVPIIDIFGLTGTRALFVVALLIPATVLVLWFALLKPLPQVDTRYRLLAFTALTSMTFVCGNIGLVMHAAVLLSLLLMPRSRIAFTATVIACACIKPPFLAYFVICLFDDRTLWRRVAAFAWRAALGLLCVGAIMLADDRFHHAWRKTLDSVTLKRQVGMGWFELTTYFFHVPAGSRLNAELALAFMVVMTLCGLAIAQWGQKGEPLDNDERLVLGMGIVPLMIPRLLDYDMVLIVPYAALLMSLIHRNAPRWLSYPLSWIFVAWLGFGVFAYAFDIHNWRRTPMDNLLFGLLSLTAGLIVAGCRLIAPKRDYA
jgi:hypothetical protein